MNIYQTREWGHFMEGIGWKAEIVKAAAPAKNCQILIKKLPPFGSVIKVLRPSSPIPYPEIEKAAERHRALFVKVEPLTKEEKKRLESNGYKEDGWPLTPTRAIQIDLSPNLETILARFHKNARYSIRKAERNGVLVEVKKLSELAEPKQTLEHFYKLFKKTGKKKGFWVPPFKELAAKAAAFRRTAFLLFGCFGEPVSGAFVILHGKNAYYSHAASTAAGRKLLAQYLVVREIIKLAKKKGCQNLNLEGVFDPRFAVSRKWKALTVFKKKFGGRIVQYPGSYTKYHNPLVKLLFRFNR